MALNSWRVDAIAARPLKGRALKSVYKRVGGTNAGSVRLPLPRVRGFERSGSTEKILATSSRRIEFSGLLPVLQKPLVQVTKRLFASIICCYGRVFA